MNLGLGLPVRTRWRWLDWPGGARRVVTAIFLSLVTWAMLAPASTFDAVDDVFPHQDKVVHGGIFLALSLLVRWALSEEWGCGRRRTAALAALACYALSIEALQPLITASQRRFEWFDMACNLAGMCAGWLLFAPVLVGSSEISPRRTGRPAGAGVTTRGRTVR